MKIRKIPVIIAIIFTGILAPVHTRAKEIGEKKDSPINIQMVQSPLHFLEVTAPTFGTYEIGSKAQEIQASGDLVVTVQDIRETLSPWQLDYTMSVLSDQSVDPKTSSNLHYKIGNGKWTMNGNKIDESSYQSQALELGDGNNGTLTKVLFSSDNTFEYRVAKENISIVIPNNSATGDYKLVQLVQLVSLPESE